MILQKSQYKIVETEGNDETSLNPEVYTDYGQTVTNLPGNGNPEGNRPNTKL